MGRHPGALAVQHSGVVRLQSFDDGPDGTLVIAESGRSVPFDIKRVYYITHFDNEQAVRGKHAHKTLEQYIFCLNGQFTLHLDDGTSTATMVLNTPDFGIRLGPRLWHTMTDFSRECVILVLADGYYDSSDYIRDYTEFLRYVRHDSI